MIEKGADGWDWGLINACEGEDDCRGGNIEIVKLMIEKGVNNWNRALYGACRGGNIEIVKLIIEKGANDWNWGLLGACYNRNIKIITLMIEKGADIATCMRNAGYIPKNVKKYVNKIIPIYMKKKYL